MRAWWNALPAGVRAAAYMATAAAAIIAVVAFIILLFVLIDNYFKAFFFLGVGGTVLYFTVLGLRGTYRIWHDWRENILREDMKRKERTGG